MGVRDNNEPVSQPFNCPYAKHPGPDPPTYVGNHYYCESAITEKHHIASKLYIDDPLWDGAGCLPETVAAMMLDCHGFSVNFL